ncbi:hypothetical protein HANVADRAFT_58472 [Hanseniaspora valbyensis NRRL Y-1626]|uniref:Zn(2)-C6 fungal-type domain-containing protein n=1 Tax=Hanseniaspora valbyensis NRRL Y-1626 TaxID=766949 RepID=A0A1B7TGI3_9ASCO|nr:hypothetical protein HANVADRAFT_58472 [Hanseniaspora valbyensis NRRL Y-1626]
MSDENQNLDENNVFNDFMKEDEENETNTTADANAVLAATEAAAAAAADAEKEAIKTQEQQQQEEEEEAKAKKQKEEEDKEDVISSAVEAAAAAAAVALASSNEDKKDDEVKEVKEQKEDNYKKIDFEKNEDLINVLGDKNSIEASTEAIIEMNGGAGKKRKAEALGQKKDNGNKKRRKRKVLSCLRCRKDKQACSRSYPCTRCIKKEFDCRFVDNITGQEFFPQPQEPVEAQVTTEKSNGGDGEIEVASAIVATAQPTEEDNLLNIDEEVSEPKEHRVEEEEEEEEEEEKHQQQQEEEEENKGQEEVKKIQEVINGTIDGHEEENIMSVIDTDLKDE